MRTQPIVPSIEDGGRGLKAKECKWPLEAGKVKETDYALEPPERNGILPTL